MDDPSNTDEIPMLISAGIIKHLHKFGKALHLYLWLHKNKVFQGKNAGLVEFLVIDAAAELEVDTRTIRRWLIHLEKIRMVNQVRQVTFRGQDKRLIRITKNKQLEDFNRIDLLVPDLHKTQGFQDKVPHIDDKKIVSDVWCKPGKVPHGAYKKFVSFVWNNVFFKSEKDKIPHEGYKKIAPIVRIKESSILWEIEQIMNNSIDSEFGTPHTEYKNFVSDVWYFLKNTGVDVKNLSESSINIISRLINLSNIKSINTNIKVNSDSNTNSFNIKSIRLHKDYTDTTTNNVNTKINKFSINSNKNRYTQGFEKLEPLETSGVSSTPSETQNKDTQETKVKETVAKPSKWREKLMVAISQLGDDSMMKKHAHRFEKKWTKSMIDYLINADLILTAYSLNIKKLKTVSYKRFVAIKDALDCFEVEEILKAITDYGEILNDDDYYWTHKYEIEDLLNISKGNLERWIDVNKEQFKKFSAQNRDKKNAKSHKVFNHNKYTEDDDSSGTLGKNW